MRWEGFTPREQDRWSSAVLTNRPLLPRDYTDGLGQRYTLSGRFCLTNSRLLTAAMDTQPFQVVQEMYRPRAFTRTEAARWREVTSDPATAFDWSRWGMSPDDYVQYRAAGFRSSWKAFFLWRTTDGAPLPPGIDFAAAGSSTSRLSFLGDFVRRAAGHTGALALITACGAAGDWSLIDASVGVLDRDLDRVERAWREVERLGGAGTEVRVALNYPNWDGERAVALLARLDRARQLELLNGWFTRIDTIPGATLEDIEQLVLDAVPLAWGEASVRGEQAA